MKYRLTVKGQVALAAAMLLIIFAAGSFGQLGKSKLGKEPAAPLKPNEVSQEQPPVDPVNGQPAASEPQGKVPAVQPADAQLQKIASTVYFKPDQWEMQAAEICKITEIVDALKPYPQLKIIVEGNINGIPGAEDSLFGVDLSLKRAQVVEQVLIGKGIDEARIIVKSNGSAEPATSEQDKLWMNRRTSIYIEGFKGD